jgi:hypothetical protein
MSIKVFIIKDPGTDVINTFTLIVLYFDTVTYNGVLVHSSRVQPAKQADFAMLVSYGCCL